MYTEEQGVGVVQPMGTAVNTLEDVSAATAVHGEYLIGRRIKIKRIMFVVTTAIVGPTTAPQVQFLRRPTPGSATGQVVIGTLTLPSGTAVGQVVYKDVSPMNLFVGDSLCLNHITQAAGGTPAGQGQYMFELELDPDTAANESKMLASV